MAAQKPVRFVARIDEEGAFVVGDRETGLTAYSYPDSPNAVHAWCARGSYRDLLNLAREIIKCTYDGEARTRSLDGFPDFHARNWERINAQPESVAQVL